MKNIIEVLTRDNIILRGICYFSQIKQKCLTVLSCSPYRNFDNTTYFESFGKFLSDIPAHYIYMDIRGTGESEGYSINEYSIDEINDTNEIIKYIRSQEWSNKIIMMHGISYSAFNALQACSLQNGPDFLFLMHVANNRWDNDVHYFGGIKTITEDINYSFGTTGQNLLPCTKCTNKELKKIKTPWYIQWFKQSDSNNKVWKDGLIKKLPPTFLICGWRDSYSYSAVKLSNIVTFTLIGPFGHKYPDCHDQLVKMWIDYNNKYTTLDIIYKDNNKIENYKGPICIVIPTPRSLWDLGYYQIKAYHNPLYTKVFMEVNQILLCPDLVGDTLEIYVSGDPVIIPTLESVRNDLRRLSEFGYETKCGQEYEIILDNFGIWGEPKLVFNCLEFKKGDYIVARITTDSGETLSVGVSRLKNGKVIIKLRPFFIPVNTYKIYLFLNRSWVPVLYPTTNLDNIILNSLKLYLPLINIDHYIKLDKYPNKSETDLLEDVRIGKIKKYDGYLEYQTINEYIDGSFSEYLNVIFRLGIETKVHVENNYSLNKYNIKTITQIKTTKTDIYDVKIDAYNNNKLIDSWQELF